MPLRSSPLRSCPAPFPSWSRAPRTGLAVAALALGLGVGPASAELRVCNGTGSRVGLALGHRDAAGGWTTEGWFNLKANACEVVAPGRLASRYYYLHAVDYDRGGEWAGRAFLCTREREFTLRGVENCLARGLDRTGFFEVDTGEQRDWTVQLTDAARAEPGRP